MHRLFHLLLESIPKSYAADFSHNVDKKENFCIALLLSIVFAMEETTEYMRNEKRGLYYIHLLDQCIS